MTLICYHRAMHLESDYKFFESKLSELLKEHRGQFVIVKDNALHGFFPAMEDALKEGYKKFGNAEFLIQEVTDEKRINYINSAFVA
jgi:hypothetical protein